MAKVRPLPPALAEAAKAELNEDPARLESDLQHLKEWLRKQPHLRARTDDQFLVAFLRGAKFSLERAKEKLDAYYTLRSALPEFFADRDPTAPEIRRIMQLGLFLPLGTDAEGRRVFLFRGCAFDPSTVNINDIFKINMMMADVMLLEDDALLVKGQVGVMDMAGMTLAHAAFMTPALAKRSATVFQDGYPLRPKAMHYIHMNSAFETVFKLMKSFMKQKIQNRRVLPFLLVPVPCARVSLLSSLLLLLISTLLFYWICTPLELDRPCFHPDIFWSTLRLGLFGHLLNLHFDSGSPWT